MVGTAGSPTWAPATRPKGQARGTRGRTWLCKALAGIAILATLLGSAQPALANHHRDRGCFGFEAPDVCAQRLTVEREAGCLPNGPPLGTCERRAGVVDPFYARILAFVQHDMVEAPGDNERAREIRAVGQAFQSMLLESKVDLLVHSLPSTVGGVYVPRDHFIVIDERLVTFTPHVVTMILIHEINHAYQEVVGVPRNCFEREIEAYTWQARLWRAWFGQGGKQPPGDDIEANFNTVLAVDNQGLLRATIERSPGYQEQCRGRD